MAILDVFEELEILRIVGQRRIARDIAGPTCPRVGGFVQSVQFTIDGVFLSARAKTRSGGVGMAWRLEVPLV